LWALARRARVRLQLGDPVLVRAGQAWVLTERAQAMAPRVRAALQEAHSLLSAERPFEPLARHHAARFDLQVLAPPFELPSCAGSQHGSQGAGLKPAGYLRTRRRSRLVPLAKA
jgi:hypothetical protein